MFSNENKFSWKWPRPKLVGKTDFLLSCILHIHCYYKYMYKLRSIFNRIFPSAPKLNTFEITFEHLETSAFLLLIQFFSCGAFVSFVLMKCLSKCPYSNKSYIVWRGGVWDPPPPFQIRPPFQFRIPSNSRLQGPPLSAS